MSDVLSLQQVRVAIEKVDEELLDALRRRMDLAEDVARAKLATASPIRDQRREDLLLVRIRSAALARGLDPHEVERLYRLIMEMSVARQHAWVSGLEEAPLRVAYPGMEGSYSHLMAHKRYAGREGGVFLTGFDTPRMAVDALRGGEVDLALLPIENTTAGAMFETYDAIAEEGVTLTSEMVDQVQHRLLGLPGAKLAALHTVRSHPQALTQCEAFLREHLPHARLLRSWTRAAPPSGCARRMIPAWPRSPATPPPSASAWRCWCATCRIARVTTHASWRWRARRGPCPRTCPASRP